MPATRSASMAVAGDRVCSVTGTLTQDKEEQFSRKGARRERVNMPRSATKAHPNKTKRPSPKRAKSTSPKKPQRTAAKKDKRTAPKRTTQPPPKRVTPTSQKKPNETSVAAAQAEIAALRTELQEARDQQTAT